MRIYLFLLFSLFFFISGAAAQVTSKFLIGEGSRDGARIIEVKWSPEEEANWKKLNEDRLEIMAVKTEISSTSLPFSNDISRYSFHLQGKYQAELLIKLETIVAREEIRLVNTKSRKVILTISDVHSGQILSPVFDPSETELIWSGGKSVFTLSTLYLSEISPQRNGSIGFGTALPCHPNAACKQDSILKLISNSAVRIRMVMEEGIGWCTGSFINNTRNDKSPLLLTAYHCTFEYTPKYDLWRFDLQYRSDSCNNPGSEPAFFSFTGCTLKAKGQASDFLLVLLADSIPSNQLVTFAGWNRDDIATADTSYLVHHPNADIRKFSTAANKAIIHPNQIGWSGGDGYTTPANHHVRFKFTEGGHQPGSSGGPVYNQDGFLVGQLHGGTAGCESTINAYAGRLSKSWNLGTSADARLKDWLDPDNTGVIQWPAIENVSENELTDLHGIVKDPHGHPVKNVSITITGSVNETLITDANGEFLLAAVNRNGEYLITPAKDTNVTNGLSALDLVAIQKHILSKDTFEFDWQYIAADATGNNKVSVGDIVLILRLLLGRISFFPSSPSWRFLPSEISVDTIPPGEPLQIEITAIKVGDVNVSADPLK